MLDADEPEIADFDLEMDDDGNYPDIVVDFFSSDEEGGDEW